MSVPEARAGALAQRLAAYLCLVAAALFGLTAVLASRLAGPRGDGLRLTGGAMLDPTAVTILVVCAAVSAVCGVGLLVTTPALVSVARLRRPTRRRPVLILALGGTALLMAFVLRRLTH